MRSIIKNGRVITAADTVDADVLIEDGRVRAIGHGLPVGDDVEVHDAAEGHGRMDYSLFEGHGASCKVAKVFLRDRMIVDDNQGWARTVTANTFRAPPRA